jgi:hypothetical protein
MLLTNAYEAMCNNSYESQGWYDNVIAVDPTNENIVWAGGIDLYRSNDGGKTWGEASYWWDYGSGGYEHADQHAIAFLPADNGATMFLGSDGGVFQTNNRLAAVGTSACSPNTSVSWTSLDNNLGITQFYDGAVFPGGSAFFGGTQDNGTVQGTPGGGSNAWGNLLGGDGGYVAVNPTNTNILYGEYTDLSIQKSTNGGSSWNTATNGINSSLDTGFLFITPFTMDPNNANTLWIGGSYIWRTTNAASSWTQASTSLSGDVSAIAVATGNSNDVAVGTSNGEVYYSTTALTTTSSTAWASATPASGYVSWVAYDPNNSSNLYATYSTFGVPHVMKSTNGGAAWTNITGNLPDVPVMSIVVNPSNSNMLFIGTDLGVYSTTNGGTTWNVETTGFGDAATDALVILSSTNTLYAFTHGYGAWSAPILGAAVCTYALSADQSVPAQYRRGAQRLHHRLGRRRQR